ncbi:hypothetical protein [Parathalassolituus penaei]|uniref:Uncharacterized protein n=1 Tax=Parathalassolituus penaei TaxID=2997323 RepID=A0A9X3EC14_9GAMM|nr:hypothetical protein [Parathalassolituus penaei]MCY0964802.1 hypothetical protein [Parathalassolituus penaei]
MDLSARYKYYQTIRRGCYQNVLASAEFGWLRDAGIVLEIASKGCIQKVVKSWESDINWEAVLRSSNDYQPRNFDVSAYLGTELVGLAVGRVSKGKNIVRIDKLERKKSCRELEGIFALLVIQIASDYAVRLGASSVRITEPRAELVDYLERHGIGIFRKGGPNYPYDHVNVAVNGE